MKSVNVSELKNHLSEYLRMVRRGQSILVRDRDRVVARIEPAGGRHSGPPGEAARLDDLERRGVIRRGRARPIIDLVEKRPAVQADVVAALIEEREEGR